MSIEIITGLIALVGVIISVTVSLYTSKRQTNIELQKLRLEIQQTYAGKLLEKRLEVYPDVYFLLSNFMKKIELVNFSRNDVVQLYNQIGEWDSKYSIFFNGDTGSISYHFRQTLLGITKMTDEEYRSKFESPDAIKELRYKVAEFELSLKSDLGIYAVEFSDLSKRFKTYKAIEEEITKPKLNL